VEIWVWGMKKSSLQFLILFLLSSSPLSITLEAEEDITIAYSEEGGDGTNDGNDPYYYYYYYDSGAGDDQVVFHLNISNGSNILNRMTLFQSQKFQPLW
jgi:hypothetical protein